MITPQDKIITNLILGFKEPSSEDQEKACIKAISDTLDTCDSQCDFLIQLRDFIITYNQ